MADRSGRVRGDGSRSPGTAPGQSPLVTDNGWMLPPELTVAAEERPAHVRHCSDFAAGLLDQHPDWAEGLDGAGLPDAGDLAQAIHQEGLESGLRLFRNREMLRIVWRDLSGLAALGETFASLTALAEVCLQAAIEEHQRRLVEKHGTPRGPDGSPQGVFVIGLGKFGGGELNLSSDIDIMFCFPQTGQCDGRRGMANDQFFTRLARGVIASLSERTEDGFCFRVDTRLRPFGNAGPLASSLAALEQYYQREGREWERYALVKARPVAGDRAAGRRFIEDIRPFVYRRYIDYSSVEALQEMHASVQDDARRTDRLDDIKRGPGGIREIEFLAQCFQILRGGREPGLQTPSLDIALREIARLDLLPQEAVDEIRRDYTYLRLLENRIQALRDQQTHRLPTGADRARIAQAMCLADVDTLDQGLSRTRQRVSDRFKAIFPARSEPGSHPEWTEQWRKLRLDRQAIEKPEQSGPETPLDIFIRRLSRVALSQRANQRLDRFMPDLLRRIDDKSLADETLNRVFDLVLAVSRRSAYLVLLTQYPQALDRMLDLFEQSDWISGKVIRFPALLDELIDPSLGSQLPSGQDLESSVDRVLRTAQDTESALEGLNYLKLATTLRIAVGQLRSVLDTETVQHTLSDLAGALLRGILVIAWREISARHGDFPAGDVSGDAGTGWGGEETVCCPDHIAVIGYGTLGARELGYDSDLDLVFLFEPAGVKSDGPRPLPPEQYYARLAQRVLSFLTVMTPSGRLYEVDTRLRPNGRAGSLVSSIAAFREYQKNEAWTWELQALTRARFVAGCPRLDAQFNRIRQEVLCQDRDADALACALQDMRERMVREHGDGTAENGHPSPKHLPGGLVDIEFVAQMGVLCSARLYPRVIRATGTLEQIEELCAIDWLSRDQAEMLRHTLLRLRQQRLMTSLVATRPPDPVDTGGARSVYDEKIAGPATNETE